MLPRAPKRPFTVEEDAELLRRAHAYQQFKRSCKCRMPWQSLCLPGRTPEQMRERWRKLRLHTPQRVVLRMPFTPEEDEALREAVLAGKTWRNMTINGRTANQLRMRWRRRCLMGGGCAAPTSADAEPEHLPQKRKRTLFSEAEDAEIRAGVAAGLNWTQICVSTGRQPHAVRRRWRYLCALAHAAREAISSASSELADDELSANLDLDLDFGLTIEEEGEEVLKAMERALLAL